MQCEQQFGTSRVAVEKDSAAGFAPFRQDGQVPLITVCAWCLPNGSPKTNGTSAANVSHGICRRHFRYVLFKYRGRQPKRFQFKGYGGDK